MNHLTRSTIAASTLVVAVGVAFAIQPRGPEPHPAPQPVQDVAPPAHPAVREDPALTQRIRHARDERGLWADDHEVEGPIHHEICDRGGIIRVEPGGLDSLRGDAGVAGRAHDFVPRLLGK